jgi:hypothetical protein
MNIEEYVRSSVIPVIRGSNYDLDALNGGIVAYTHYNGFYDLDSRFSENVIQRVIQNNLASVLTMQPKDIVLFFSNYSLIESVKLVNNRSLALADSVRTGKQVLSDDIRKVEKEFEKYMLEVCKISGLREFLGEQISEIILNIDYAKGVSHQFSQRLSSISGVKR